MASMPYDDRLDRLLSTAADVFARQGYHATSMRDLSRETGMSLAGIYYYVKGKDDLLFQIQERCFTAVMEGARDAVRQGTDAADRMRRFIQHHLTFFAEHMSEMKVLSHEADSLSSERQEEIDHLKKRYVGLVAELIEEAAAGSHATLAPRVAAYGLFGMMNWIYTWYDPAGPVAPDGLAAQFAGIFLHGILAPTASSLSQGG